MKNMLEINKSANPEKTDHTSVSNKVSDLLKRYRILSLLLIILVYVVIFSIKYTDDFPTLYNFSTVMLAMSIGVIVTLGMTLLLISGEIDLSVGWNMALSGIICAHFIVYEFYSIPKAIVITLAISIVLGLINGLLVAVIGVNSFITTLAAGLIYYGFALKISGGSTITHLPDEFNIIGQFTFMNFQIPVWYALILVVIFAYLMSKTTIFRRYYYIGINKKAAALSGINVKKMKVIAFIITSVLAGFAGIISAARFGNAMILAGQGMELKAITAAVVGGVSFTGGVGTIIGAVTGAFFMALIDNGLIIAEVNAYWQQIIVGIILLIAVIIDIVLSRRRT